MERLTVLQERMGQAQEKRVAKAVAESPDWVWTQTPFGWIVTTPGGTYQVNERGQCSCKDYTHACCGTELRCKHAVGLKLKLLAEGTTAPAPASTPKGLPLMTDAEVARMDRLYA